MSTATIRPAAMMNQRPASAAPAASGGVALDPVRLLRKYYPLLLGAAVLGAALGTAANFVLKRTMPFYTASATFAVSPEVVGKATDFTSMSIGGEELTRFMGTQMSLITSPVILEKVVSDAEVEQTGWAKQYMVGGQVQPALAQAALERDLKVRAVPQTSLFRVSITWRDPLDCRKIIDAVQRVYQADQRRQASLTSVGQRQVLNERLKGLDAAVKNLQDSRNRVLSEKQVTDLNSGLSSVDLQAQQLSDRFVAVSSALTASRNELQRLKSQLENEAVIQFPDNMREEAKRDPVVLGLDQNIASYKTDVRALRLQGFGPEHPTVIAAQQRVDAATKERDDALQEVLRKLFNAKISDLESNESGLAAQQAKLEKDILENDAKKRDLTQARITIKEIDDDLQRVLAERADVDASMKNVNTRAGSEVFDRVRLIVPAQTPSEMTFPKLSILLPIGVVLLTGLTATLVLLREVLDQRVRGPADLAMMARMRILGMVADAQEDPTRPANLATAFRDSPSGVTAESFRLLRSSITKAMDQAGHKSLLVLSGMPGSGATSVVTNVALACAGADERVLVIDANLRRPGVHKVFGLPDGPGLGDVLAGQSTLDAAARATTTRNVTVLTAGTPANRGLPERLSGETMARLLKEAADKYDRVIVDSSPAIVSGDGFALANRVDCVALVVRALQEKRGLVNRLRTQLSESRGEFLGVVVNAVRASAGGYLRGNIKASHEYQHGGQGA
jgi:capsular exopolysaccharide synthesis family protein